MYDYYEEPEYYNPEDFLEDYEVELRETMVNAVNKKIKNSLEELERLRTKYKESLDEIHTLKYKLGDINRQHKKNLEEEYKKGYKEAERNLGLGFAVNDEIYYINSERKSHKCPHCNGNYKIKVDVLGKEQEVNCPYCSYGKINEYTYYPEKDKISSLKFYIARKDRNSSKSPSEVKLDWGVDIYLERYDNSLNPNSLYHSLEECQKVCDEKNLKENNK